MFQVAHGANHKMVEALFPDGAVKALHVGIQIGTVKWTPLSRQNSTHFKDDFTTSGWGWGEPPGLNGGRP
jgi:hypothetical protein